MLFSQVQLTLEVRKPEAGLGWTQPLATEFPKTMHNTAKYSIIKWFLYILYIHVYPRAICQVGERERSLESRFFIQNSSRWRIHDHTALEISLSSQTSFEKSLPNLWRCEHSSAQAQSKTHPNPRHNSTTQISHLSQAAFGTCRSIDHKSIGSIDLKTQNMFNNVQTCSKIFKRITGVQLNSLNDWMIWNHWPHGWPATMICRATKIRWPSKPSRFGSGHENFIAQAA